MPLRISAATLKALTSGRRGAALHVPATRGAGKKDQAAATLLFQLRIAGLPAPTPELQFHPTRRWQFDLAWPVLKLAVEIEGVIYPDKRDADNTVLRGRHVSPKGFRDDCVKYGEAFAAGWTVLRVLPEQINDGSALRWLTARLRP